MRIITVSRQFGSGGRELGKRLAGELGWDYYDKEIIERLSEAQGMNEQYVQQILNNHEWNSIPLTFRSSFSGSGFDSWNRTQLLIKQREIIESIAAVGNDCIIVGRDADIILRDSNPFRIFVCAEMESRLARCMKHEQKKESGQLTEREVKRNIRRIDRQRASVREMLTGKDWGDGSAFDLTINASGRDIKHLASMTASFALQWFEEK